LKLFYPDRGNFIAVLGKLGQRFFAGRLKRAMKGAADVPLRSIAAPRALPGVEFADRRNDGPRGIDAVMITDTAFCRNEAYHTPADAAGTVDYERMAEVVESVDAALRRL